MDGTKLKQPPHLPVQRLLQFFLSTCVRTLISDYLARPHQTSHFGTMQNWNVEREDGTWGTPGSISFPDAFFVLRPFFPLKHAYISSLLTRTAKPVEFLSAASNNSLLLSHTLLGQWALLIQTLASCLLIAPLSLLTTTLLAGSKISTRGWCRPATARIMDDAARWRQICF